jgi:acetyltransferase-like isoleucine patch superfamily enzyme
MNRIKYIFNKVMISLLGPIIDFVRLYSSRRPFIKGSKSRVKLGARVSLMDTIINVSSGDVEIGDDTIFGHSCVLVTGVHEFEGGMRKKLFHRQHYSEAVKEVPLNGYDIKIGSGCWITSNVTITGGVTVGDNVIIMAGAVVTKDMPSSSVVGGVPAKVVRRFD